MKKTHNQQAFTIVELLCASAISIVILAGASVGVIALQKSFRGSQQYAAGMNDGSRLVDYVSRDLRNAVKVTRVQANLPSPFKSGSIEVTGLDQLSISVPDYYLSNTPENTSGSPFKSPRFGRNNLPAGATYYPYDSVVAVVGVTRVPKYPGEVEIRYIKKARSPSDPTLCYFRREYEGAALRSEEEIATAVENQKLMVAALDTRRFRIFTNFKPQWSSETRRAGTQQVATVKILNLRAD